MGTGSASKPAEICLLFRVTIDFLTKAMASLISALVCHLTLMAGGVGWGGGGGRWKHHIILGEKCLFPYF